MFDDGRAPAHLGLRRRVRDSAAGYSLQPHRRFQKLDVRRSDAGARQGRGEMGGAGHKVRRLLHRLCLRNAHRPHPFHNVLLRQSRRRPHRRSGDGRQRPALHRLRRGFSVEDGAALQGGRLSAAQPHRGGAACRNRAEALRLYGEGNRRAYLPPARSGREERRFDGRILRSRAAWKRGQRRQ